MVLFICRVNGIFLCILHRADFFSAGDLLREEQIREGSEYKELIQSFIREGKIVPMEVTIALLEKAMQEAIANEGKKRFLIDGFPRKMDQACKFEEVVRWRLLFCCQAHYSPK